MDIDPIEFTQTQSTYSKPNEYAGATSYELFDCSVQIESFKELPKSIRIGAFLRSVDKKNQKITFEYKGQMTGFPQKIEEYEKLSQNIGKQFLFFGQITKKQNQIQFSIHFSKKIEKTDLPSFYKEVAERNEFLKQLKNNK